MKQTLIKDLLGGGWGRCTPLGERVAWNRLLYGEGEDAVPASDGSEHRGALG